jgi:uncharacterized protein YndB with AHSA1/START domain
MAESTETRTEHRAHSLTPTGKLVRLADQLELQLTRSFRADIDDVWASVTEPDRTARWIGSWEGEGAPGNTVRLRMIFEDEPAPMPLLIESCEAPHLLAVSAEDEQGLWRMELRLSQHGPTTDLQLVQVLTSPDGIGEIGPGWEYYLDMLVAAREDAPQPNFDDYYPAQKSYYEGLASNVP